jgi:hypothetical protein
MKPISILLMVVVFLATCGGLTVIPMSTAAPAPTATATVDTSAADESAVRALVENFGKKLQSVSLLAPDAAQEIQTQYADFVSPDLLKTWQSDVSKAPGRLTSSPWPDRIEISTQVKDGSDKYVIIGVVIEVTSVEAVNGGAFARQPVRLVVQKLQGGWHITEYTAEQ